MTSRRIGWGLASVLFIVVAVWPASAPADDTGGKIKVIVENAPLRVKPAMDSEVLAEGVPLGTVFNIGNKIGEWFEVQYQSKMGVMITGYIHEMYAEVVPAEPKTAPAATTSATRSAQSTYKLVRDTSHRVELGLGFGLGFGSFLDATSTYNRTWGPWLAVEQANDKGTLSHEAKNPLGLGFSLNYYFLRGFGLRLRADFNFKQSFSDPGSQYDLTGVFSGGSSFRDSKSWGLSGDMSITPISLDVIYKFQSTGMFQPYVNAGISYFMGNVNLESSMGFSFSYLIYIDPDWWQQVEYLNVPLKKIDQSLNSLGFNVGLGADIYLTPTLAMNLDAVYFIGKNYSLEWEPIPGDYPGTVHPEFIWHADPDWLNETQFSSFEVSTSFFKVMLGLKVGF
jgi:opacity protein-like surface antigen